ncbi:MAG: hypothetical protein HGA45_26135 [Chloroflexales bacterium]|nr:hypothetical protein [Chloroflexales bacterium]
MLYLEPPYLIVNGVTIFRDHSDREQLYFMPAAPRLTMLTDPATRQRIPQFQLIKYRGRAGNGGFLNFDCNLGLEQAELDEIRDEARRQLRLRNTPRLAPVPLVDGTVKLMLLGKQTGDEAEADSAAPQFVLKISHHAKPSLYGTNQAGFSVALDQEGVTVLEQAMQGEMSPLLVVYSLDYLALRPAYSVRLAIDWDRVQKHFDEHFGANTWFFSADIDKAVDELIDSRAIVIEADTFVPEGEDADGVIGRRDEALNQVRDMVTEAFFEPSLDPFKEEEDGWDKAAGFFERLAPMNMYRGRNALFTYSKLDYTRIDRKSLNVNISERTTVKRTIHPQGHLAGITRTIVQEGLDPAKFIIPVDLDSAWFERRRVTARSRASFDEDGIATISVRMQYGDQPKNVVLDSPAAAGTVDWASLVADGAMRRDVRLSYTVNFKNVDSSERPVALSSPETITDVELLEINPRELYAIVPVPIIGLNFPWRQYPTVEVRTRYVDQPNGINLADSFLLTERAPEALWKLFVLDPRKTSFQYKLVFRAANHKDIEMPWVETDEERVIARDPFPKKRTLDIAPSFNWLEVDRVFVDVGYKDPDRRIEEEVSFEFTEADHASKTFTVDLQNPDLRRVTYSVTVMYRDGRLLEIPRSATLDRRVIVHAGMRGHRIISVSPASADFVRKRVKEMLVELRYEDLANGVSFSDQISFGAAGERGNFEFDFVDETRTAYEYQVRYKFTNGLSRTVPWKLAAADELLVPVG